MRGDLDRLDRVAHRFERIGREPTHDPLDVAAIVDHITKYFQARVPTLANTIAVESSVAPDLPQVFGDPVLPRVGGRSARQERRGRARRPRRPHSRDR